MVSTPFFRSGLPAFAQFDSEAHQRPSRVMGDSYLRSSVWVRAWCVHARSPFASTMCPVCSYWQQRRSKALPPTSPLPLGLRTSDLFPSHVRSLAVFVRPPWAALLVALPSFTELPPSHAHTQRDLTLSVPRFAHSSLSQRDPRIAYYPFFLHKCGTRRNAVGHR